MTEEEFARMHDQPPPKPDSGNEETDAIKVGFVKKIRSILERVPDARMFLEIQQMAQLARQFLLVSDPTQGIAHLRRPYGGIGGFSPLDDGLGGIIEPMQPVIGGPMNGPETFGANFLREIVGAVKETKNPQAISDLTRAIADAKEAGLDDIVERLKKELNDMLDARSEKQTMVVVPPPSADESLFAGALVAGMEIPT